MLRGCRFVRSLQLKCFQRRYQTVSNVSQALLNMLETQPQKVEQMTYSIEPPSTKDTLCCELEEANSKVQLLDLIEKHGVVMNGSHLMQCWERFAFLVEVGENVEELRSLPGFALLMEWTDHRISMLSRAQIVTLYNLAAQFPLEAESNVVEGLCQVMSVKLGKFDLPELLDIQSCLKKFSGFSPRTEILKLALPVAFECRVQFKLLEDANPLLSYKALLFALVENINPETCDSVGRIALKHCKEFSLLQAFKLLKCTSDATETALNSEPIKEVLISCMDILAVNRREISLEDTEIILHCCNVIGRGSKKLFETLWALAPTRPFNQTVSLLQTSFKANYLSLPAAELAVDLLLENKDQHIEKLGVTRLAEAVALVFLHHDPDSERATRAIQAGRLLADAYSKIDKIIEFQPHLFAEFMLCLGVMGIFPNDRLDVLFDADFQQKISQHEMSIKFLDKLEQCLTMHLGDSNPYRIIPELKAQAQDPSTHKKTLKSLTETLELALGGEQFLAKNVSTPLGIHADYVVAMRKGEYAIAVSDSNSYLFEKLPSESKLVAILLEKEEQDTFMHTGLRKLLFSLCVRHLKLQNLCVVVINQAKFESLPHYERIPHVMKNLKEVLRNGPIYSGSSTPSKYN